MIFQSCMLIFIFNFIVKIHCDEISLLKEYFTTSLIEENRDILSQPLTQEIEDLINHKIEGFRSLIAGPLMIGNRRTKRDASNNEIPPKNESSDIYVIKGFEERAYVPVNFAKDICMFKIRGNLFAISFSHHPQSQKGVVNVFWGHEGKFEQIHEETSDFTTAIDCIAVDNIGYVAVANRVKISDVSGPDKLLQVGSFVLKVTMSEDELPKIEIAQKFARFNHNGVRMWSRETNLYLIYTFDTFSDSPLNICVIFEMTGSHFNPLDSLPCQNARVVEFFTVHSQLMMFIGNYKENNGTSNARSSIMRYDLSTKRFLEHQKIFTRGITAAKYFFLDHQTQRQHFLLFGNSLEIDDFGNVNTNVKSMIYKYNDGSFSLVQLINIKDIQSIAPIYQQQDTEEFNLLITSKGKGMQILNYDGWKFEETPMDLTSDLLSSGISSVRTYKDLVKGTTTIVVANEESFEPFNNIFTPVYMKRTNTQDYKKKIASWCSKATERMNSFQVDENLEALQNSFDMRSDENEHAKFMGKISLKNSKAKIITTNSFQAGTLSFTDATAERITAISRRQEKLQKMTKRVGEKVKFSMATGKRIRRDASSHIVDKLIVTGDLKVETINGRKISSLLTQSRKNMILSGIEANEVVIEKRLFVNNKIDGVEMTEDNVFLDRPQKPFRPFAIENLTVNSLNDVIFMNQQPFQEFFVAFKKKHGLKLPRKFNTLEAKEIVVRNWLNGNNFTGIVENSLKLTGDQLFIAPVHIKKLTAQSLEFVKSSNQTISNIPLVHLIDTQNMEKDVVINQDIQFAHELNVNDLRVKDRINNINVKDGKLQVMRKSGNITRQVVTGEKFYNRVKLMSPIMLRGKISSRTLGKMNPTKTVDESLTLAGDYHIFGPVMVKKLMTASEDIKTTDSKYSMRRLVDTGLNLFTTNSSKTNFEFRNVVEVQDNLQAASINQKIIDKFVKTNYPHPQKIEALTIFKNSLLVQNGEVQGEIINDVDILQLNRTILKKFQPGTQFISGNVEIKTLHTPQINSQGIFLNGKHHSMLLSKNQTQQIKKLIVGQLTANNVKIHNLIQKPNGKIFEENLNLLLTDIVRRDTNETMFIQPKKFSHLTVDHLMFDESNGWKNVIRNYENALTQELTFDENIEFRSDMVIDNLEFSGTINGVNFDDFNKWLKVEGEQTFTAPQFVENLEIDSNLDLPGELINNVNISDVIDRTVWIDDRVINLNELEVDGDVIVKNEILSPTVNGVFLKKVLLLNSTREYQEVTEMSGQSLQMNFLDFTHVNEIDCEKLVQGLTNNSDQSTLHITRGKLKFNSPLSLYHLNDMDLKELYENVWISNREVALTGDNIEFWGGVKVLDGYSISSDSINYHDLFSINENYLSVTKDQNIRSIVHLSGDGIFLKSFTADKVIVPGEIIFDQNKKPLNISYFNQHVFKHHGNQQISGQWTLKKLIIEGDYYGRINGLDFLEDVLHENFDTEITGWKYFPTVDAYSTNTQIINDVNVYDWIKYAIYKNVSRKQSINGHVAMHHAKFFNNLVANGFVNGRKIDQNSVLTRSNSDTRILQGNLTFISTPQSPSTVKNIFISHSLNGKEINDLMTNSLRSGDDVIESKLVFSEPLEVENLETEQKIFGVDMDQFARESGASKDLERFQRNLLVLSKIGRDIKASFNDHAVELNHFEYIQSISSSNALKIVDLVISKQHFVAVHERDPITSFDSVTFYRWDNKKERFQEETSIVTLKYNFKFFEISQVDKVIYQKVDHLFVEIFDRTSGGYQQNLMTFDNKSQTFISNIQTFNQMSTKLLTIGNGLRACYASIIIGMGNLNIVCVGDTTILSTPPIKSIESLNNLLIILVSTNDTESQIQIWKGERFINALNILNPQSFTIAHHKNSYYLAVISGRVEKSTHHGSIEIFESSDTEIDFKRVQSFGVENPFKLRFSEISTGDLLLYILTKQPGKALVVYVHAGASHFTKFLGDEVTIINTGTDLTSISIAKKHEIVLIVSKEIFVIKAVLKEF